MLERKAEIRYDDIRAQRVLFGEMIAATYNVNRDPKKRPEPYTWRDIFPDHEGPAEQEAQTDEQMLMSMHMWTALFKAREKAGMSN